MIALVVPNEWWKNPKLWIENQPLKKRIRLKFKKSKVTTTHWKGLNTTIWYKKMDGKMYVESAITSLPSIELEVDYGKQRRIPNDLETLDNDNKSICKDD